MFLFKKLIHALTVLASTLHEAMDLESSSSWACQKIKNKQVSCANTMHFLNQKLTNIIIDLPPFFSGHGLWEHLKKRTFLDKSDFGYFLPVFTIEVQSGTLPTIFANFVPLVTN